MDTRLAAQTDALSQRHFEFDYLRNVILFNEMVILLSPHEADILRVLLNHRSGPVAPGTLIQRVYGGNEPDAAATSIRVAIHSLRKKIAPTGLVIRARPRLGYEIDASGIPELNRRLSDKILIAINLARATEQHDVAEQLQIALALTEARRDNWDKLPREMIQNRLAGD